QLGDGTTTRRTTPVRVGSLTDVVGIAGGRDHGLALRGDGTVWAWGSNDYGQIGDGTLTDRTSPVQVQLPGGARQVIAGAHHSYALRTDGTVAAWGRNYRANLGDGTTTNRTRPVSVRNLSSVTMIGSGRDTGMAVLADGRLMSWGSNSAGQIGDGTTVNRSTAVLVPGVSGAALAGGGGQEYAVVVVAPTTPPPTTDPVAAFTSTCTGTSCTFDAGGSRDPDGGALVGFAWTFGDGESASGPGSTTPHVFAASGTYTVTLTVTDDEGATASVSRQVLVQDQPPPTDGPQWRATGSSDSNSARPAVTVPGSVQSTDRLVLFVTANRAATLTTPAGWTVAGTVSDSTDARSWVLTRTAGPGLAGTNLQLTLDALSKTSLVLLAYSGAGAPSAVTSRAEPGSSATHTAPAATVVTDASRVVRYYVDKASDVHTWTLPSVLTARATTTGSGGGLLVAAAGDEAWPSAGTAPALAATSSLVSGKAIGWTLVLPPA
ncbi:PKD domain-containing protein, partial [Nocardioides sp. P5_C9_2]